MSSPTDVSGSPDLALRVGRLENDVHAVYEMVGDVQTELRSHGRRLGRIEVRLDGIDGRLAAHDARFDAIDARFDAIDGRLAAHDVRFDAIDTRFDAIDARSDAMENRFGTMEIGVGAKLDRILLVLEPSAPA